MLRARRLTDKGLVRHLQRHRRIASMVGFKTIQYKTAIGRWKKRCWKELRHAFVKTTDIILMRVKTKIEIIDSTPFRRSKDLDAKVGFTSKGVALRAIITPGNEHDSSHMPNLIVEPDYITW